MVTRRQLLTGLIAASVAALLPWKHAKDMAFQDRYWPRGRGEPATVWTEPGTTHLNARHYPRPTVPHFTHHYGNGNTWYSLTTRTCDAMKLRKHVGPESYIEYAPWACAHPGVS